MATVTAKGLRKFYGNVSALNDVSIEIEEGKLLAVIGPSGSGKTTLLRSIAGFVKLDGGRIYLDDDDITDVPPEKRNISMFFQNYALWPHMTVYDNVAYGLKLRKYPKGEVADRVRWALSLLGVEGLEDRKPNQLSGGQQQRIALARAIVVEPRVLLLDEPLSNLDAKIRLRIRFEIKALQQKLRLTTLYVTHDQEEALSIADEVAVMHEGRILQVGTPQEIYTRPDNFFVADFVGINNVLERTVQNGGVKLGELFIPVEGKSDGSGVVVVFRADEIELDRDTSFTQPDEYGFTGVITGKLYMGSRYRYEISVSDSSEDRIIANSPKDFPLSEKVFLHVKKEKVFIY